VRWKRWLGIAFVTVVVVLLVVYGFRPQPALVETAEAKRGPLRVTVEEEGKTRVTDRFVVSAPVAGFARRVTLDVGDPVKQGQEVLLLEPLRSAVLDPRSRAEAEARVEAAEASLRAAREKARAAAADAAYWEGELARMRKLYKTDDISEDRYERTVTSQRQAEATRRSAEHTVEVAQSELDAARAALKYSAAVPANPVGETVAVHAPVGGRVLKVVHKSEGVVNPGDPLLEIANARSLEVEVEVLSADAVRISPGARVLFERWGGGELLEGRVRRIEPVAFTKISALGVEEQRVLVIADITSPPGLWRRLGDGYRVEASFILWEAQDVLQIPASALFRHQDGWAVFAVEEGFARRREVEVGRRNGLVAQILSGLSEGAIVITHPDDSIEDGKPVKQRS
jgi:HlyD family secretion protein